LSVDIQRRLLLSKRHDVRSVRDLTWGPLRLSLRRVQDALRDLIFQAADGTDLV